ncbi:MAG: 2-oxoacid:acceptor oxidoreductase subunit alpha [Desulfobacteraceae bacterium]
MTVLNLIVAGEAGQGLATIGEILARTMVRHGLYICVTQDYQSRIRGGHNTFSVRVSDEEIAAPATEYDVLVALNQESVDLHKDWMTEKGVIIADAELQSPRFTISVPFKELADTRMWNVAALGILAVVLGLDTTLLQNTIDDHFKRPELADKNREVLERALEWARRNAADKTVVLPDTSRAERLMLNGNQAIALGSISAGVRFYSFYPMTPATSIALTLIKYAEKAGILVEQAEDEIAALNMALGASFAGAPAMTGTSGGGFALMVEGLSLAGMTETPVVIALAQRPGPATGLPTRTEQADLEFAIHGGHGEFPRLVLAPGCPEQCFELTHKAFHLAEKYQSPVIILTDQFLADSYRSVEPFDMESKEPVKAGENGKETSNYKRYRFTENGVSPRRVPGWGLDLVVADSDEHFEDGHITEDHEVRVRMVEKRLRKMEELKSETQAPIYEGDENPDMLLVTWGSAIGAVREAARKLSEEGKSVATLHFCQVWPLAPDQFTTYLQKAGRTVAVESNATGQFARLIRRETGIEINDRVLRYDGLPLTAEQVLQEVRGLEGGHNG